MIVPLILISTLFVVVSYIAWVQYSRANKAESIANILSTNMKAISDIIKDSKTVLDNPELVQAFSNDDEVGKFFTGLKDIQDTLNLFIEDDEK